MAEINGQVNFPNGIYFTSVMTQMYSKYTVTHVRPVVASDPSCDITANAIGDNLSVGERSSICMCVIMTHQ